MDGDGGKSKNIWLGLNTKQVKKVSKEVSKEVREKERRGRKQKRHQDACAE